MLLRANQHSGPTMDSDDDNAMHMVNNCDSIAIFDAFHGGFSWRGASADFA